MGLPAGHLRDPLKPLSPEQTEKLHATMVKWGLLKDGMAKRAAE